jgi:CheY-like chemotaxis protein
MAHVVALVDDLFFQAKLVETAKHLGVELRTCTTPDAMLAEITENPPRLVVVDLNARNNPLEAVERVQASAGQIPLLGFLSHVQVELAQKARAAGCHDVMPRRNSRRTWQPSWRRRNPNVHDDAIYFADCSPGRSPAVGAHVTESGEALRAGLS